MRTPGEVEAHDAGDDQGEAGQLDEGCGLPEGEDADARDERGAGRRPDGVDEADRQLAQHDRHQPERQPVPGHHDERGQRAAEPVAETQGDGGEHLGDDRQGEEDPGRHTGTTVPTSARPERGPAAGEGAATMASMAETRQDVDVPEEVVEVEREPLDGETLARREAALRHVVQFGDPVLRAAARPVEVFDDALRAQLEQMGALMNDALGIGLAATQLGQLSRFLVYRVEPDSPVRALVNPIMEWSSPEKEWMEEGCLSLPGVHVDVERPMHVRVRAQDGHGAPLTVEASGLEARVIQHEMDHLDGVLILDRTPRDQRKQAMRILRERLQTA